MEKNQDKKQTQQVLQEKELQQINGGATGTMSDSTSTLPTTLIKLDRPPYQTTPVFIVTK
ncbi:bacteriocin [Spirosoma sp. SC4-14]|uniref:bacteriocin n=1 Tax=Spirosoma sp. SC4-14 TaxID=3128900 RepID=UPI0030D03D04